MEEKPFEGSLGLEQANKQSPEKIAKKKKFAIFGGVIAVALLLMFVVFTQAEFFLGQATTEFEEEIALEQAASGENATGNPTTEDPEEEPEEAPEEDPEQNTGDPDSIEQSSEECLMTIDDTNFEGGVYTFKVLSLENLEPSELDWGLQIIIDPLVSLNVGADRMSSTLELPETFEGQFTVIVSHTNVLGEIECSEMWTVDVISEIEDPDDVPDGDPEESPDPDQPPLQNVIEDPNDNEDSCTLNINPVSESEDNFLFEIQSVEGFEDASDLQWIMSSEPDHENELQISEDNLSATLAKTENYEGVIDVLVTKNDIEGVLLCSASWTVEVANEDPEQPEDDPETDPEEETDPENPEEDPETTPEEEEELICESISHTAPTVVEVDGVPHWEVCASSHPQFTDFIWNPEPVEEIANCTFYEITPEGGEVNIGHESSSKCSESLTLPGCAEFNEQLIIMISNGNLTLAEIFREQVEALGLSCFEDETPEDPEQPEDNPETDPEEATEPEEDPEDDPDPVDDPEEETEQCTINQSPVNLENGVYEFKIESFEGFEDPNDLEWSMSFDPAHENEMTLSEDNMTASVDEPNNYSGELRVFVSKNNIEGLAICSSDWSVEISTEVSQNDPPVRDDDPEEDPEEDPIDPEDPPQLDQFAFQDDDDEDDEPIQNNNNGGNNNDNDLPPVLTIDDNNNNNGNNFASSNGNSDDDDDDNTVTRNTIVRTVINQDTQEEIVIPNGGRTVIELQDPEVREELDIASNYVITEIIDPSGQVSILAQPIPLHSAAPIIQGDTGPETLIYSLALAISGMIFFGMKKVRARRELN